MALLIRRKRWMVTFMAIKISVVPKMTTMITSEVGKACTPEQMSQQAGTLGFTTDGDQVPLASLCQPY